MERVRQGRLTGGTRENLHDLYQVESQKREQWELILFEGGLTTNELKEWKKLRLEPVLKVSLLTLLG